MKNKYKVIIYWSNEDKKYLAEVPELSGCMADGKTQMEALKNVELIVEEWLETAKIIGRNILASKYTFFHLRNI